MHSVGELSKLHLVPDSWCKGHKLTGEVPSWLNTEPQSLHLVLMEVKPPFPGERDTFNYHECDQQKNSYHDQQGYI